MKRRERPKDWTATQPWLPLCGCVGERAQDTTQNLLTCQEQLKLQASLYNPLSFKPCPEMQNSESIMEAKPIVCEDHIWPPDHTCASSGLKDADDSKL